MVGKLKSNKTRLKSVKSDISICEELNDEIKFCSPILGWKRFWAGLSYALKFTNVKCLIIIQSKNPESYMFHTPNISWAKVQAEAIGIHTSSKIPSAKRKKN